MSKINELIQTLCPDGVEYKKLGEVGCVRMCKRIMKDQTSSTGDVPFYKIGTFGGTANAYITQELFDEYSSRYNYPKKGNILISAAGTIGRTVVFDGKPSYFQDSNIVWLEHDGTQVTDEYLKYIYSTSPWYVADGGTISRLYNNNILNAVIPVPPRPVQDEIVRILDEYTDLEAELEAKLSEEIELKQKQYEYCASKLFEDLNVEYISMSELAKFKYGYTDKASDSGNARFIRITDIDDFGELSSADEKYIMLTDDSEKYLLTKGSLVVARTGATYGKTLYFDSDEPSVYASFLIKIDFDNNQVLNRYYWHFTKTSLYWEQANKYVKVGGQQQFNSPALGRVCVPVPSITEQERIVKTLDKYDTYTRDMISALNTELESRKKQYAYYRDQLLTFKRKE